MGYWEDKEVLVTGATGFVGTNLIKALEKKRPLRIISPTRAECDLTKEADVSDYFYWAEPDVVIHLAGLVGGIGINKQKPADFFYENAMMGILVTHYSFVNGVKRMVSLAAGCGYPKHLDVPYSEEDFWKGLPDENSIGYSMAKKNLIIQSWAYRDQYGFNSTVLLPANLYGPHDNFDLEESHVVPALIRKFVEAKAGGYGSVDVWGSGTASREFLYVDDAARVILDVVEKYNESGPLNLGTGKETTISELVSIIKELTEYDGDVWWDESKPDGQPRRFYDMSKLKAAIGYVPDTNIIDGLVKTIGWYKWDSQQKR